MSRNSKPPDTSPRSYGGSTTTVIEPTGEVEASPPPGEGKLIITLVDHNNLHPEGIPVEVNGPRSFTANSDAKGRVTITGPPGRYGARVVAGCSGQVIVEFGESGGGELVPGQTANGNLRVQWEHQIAPGDGAYSSQVPYWIVGREVDVTYDVVDRCKQEKAPSAHFPTYAFETSPNLELLGTPSLSSNERAQAMVKVRCTSAGPVDLFVYDRSNPTDRKDLTDHMIDRVECRNG